MQRHVQSHVFFIDLFYSFFVPLFFYIIKRYHMISKAKKEFRGSQVWETILFFILIYDYLLPIYLWSFIGLFMTRSKIIFITYDLESKILPDSL